MGKVAGSGNIGQSTKMPKIDFGFKRNEFLESIFKNLKSLTFQETIKLIDDREEVDFDHDEMKLTICMMKGQSNDVIEEIYRKSGGFCKFTNYLPAALIRTMAKGGSISPFMFSEIQSYLNLLEKKRKNKELRWIIENVKESLEIAS
jgi:hypothetical protein